MKNFFQKLKQLWNQSPKEFIPGVDVKYSDQIIELFKSYPAIKEVVLYGSRAKNTYQEYSDIDLCIIKKGEGIISGLALELEDLNIPYMIDLVQYSEAGEHLQKNIDKDKVVIYTK